MKNDVLTQVQHRIQSESISLQEAAAAIGIGTSALMRHLAGEYVRSDSLAKYRLWLSGAGRQSRPIQLVRTFPNAESSHSSRLPRSLTQSGHTLPRPRYVVDLFCGCGGMSLGFERSDAGQVYRIAMALDIEDAMVRVFNDNHPSPSGVLPIARHEDITDFMNEAEIQAYYLDHIARSSGDEDLIAQLQKVGIPGLRKRLHDLDSAFLTSLASYRSQPEYLEETRAMGSAVLGQTSVAGFHSATKLPTTGSAYPRVGPLIWHHDGDDSDARDAPSGQVDNGALRACRTRARKLWDAEVSKLTARADGAGRGQLASAAERIRKFQQFLDTGPMQRIKRLWLDWRASREEARMTFFGDAEVQSELRSIYENGHQVSVLLGGPPCQGFSRIGRGKIRSLREQGVHVHEDEDSVDSRNQLMHQYVLFVAALSPEVFLFENVKHFQAVVKSEGIEFDAADILAEAIEAVSARGLHYDIARRIVVASEHAVPQNRERFVMAGIRGDVAASLSDIDAASWVLSLEKRLPVPLSVALEGLPTPDFESQGSGIRVRSEDDGQPGNGPIESAEAVFRNWTFRGTSVDAHIARPPRPDDEAFFALMGPGKRWMDYRCDDAPTLQRINDVLVSLRKTLASTPGLSKKMGVSLREVSSLSMMTDGSLSLRLLLEGIAPHPGELQHHLLAENYLKKRGGAHGDWLSRMDPAQPSKTIVSHMAKDTYAYVHPFLPRTLSVREAARVQSFPDDYRFGSVGLVDGFRVVGNAVPPLLSQQFAERVTSVLSLVDASREAATEDGARRVAVS
ncbi:DNA cytosine methyltransferase [Luteimonas kalidii]|uniref:DNA (cytosine-5-)-methyltransferase n=1 Tax=Luteimonas kalidii TaxID=3042025 RepID=A0ABT6JXB0_9GAMM|nr:DNA cytosine methyltransferase [Luteimonas kalidii]MDH5835323.1 DNA cytosine methyltransferase [Luteimonas kalidii]